MTGAAPLPCQPFRPRTRATAKAAPPASTTNASAITVHHPPDPPDPEPGAAAADGAGRSPARLTVPPSPGVSAPDEVEPLPLDVLAGSPDGLEAAVGSAVESPDDPGDPDGPEAPVDVAPPDGEVPVTGEETPVALVDVAG